METSKNTNQNIKAEKLVDSYLFAKNYVIRNGYDSEIFWQKDRDLLSLTEDDFLQQAAWVILSSGMRAAVIEKVFPDISLAFFYWRSSEEIVQNRERCVTMALKSFRHEAKIQAIITIARWVESQGFHKAREMLLDDGMDIILSFPFMGPATSLHLAKNIGIDVAKPDRHLCRMAETTGFHDPSLLCRAINEYVDDSVSVIDVVLWRFATIYKDYTSLFNDL